MNTELLAPKDLEKAAHFLRMGEIVAFPTETVYGLGARIFDPEAIQKIFSVKGRPSDNPLIAHISSLEQISMIAIELSEDFIRLAEAFFPGPLTIVCKRHPSVPDIATAGLDTLGVRMPNHPLARDLISLVGEPLVAPSANVSGRPSSTCFSHVLEDFEGKIAAVVEAEGCFCGIESTIVQLQDDRVVVLRPGAISAEQIEQVVKKPVETYTFSRESEKKVLCPGVKYRHYSPKGELQLFTSWDALLREAISFKNYKVMVVGPTEMKKEVDFTTFATLSRHSLYHTLRRCDSEGYEKILVYCSPEILQDLALMNRLSKAASL
jgi:L-threonylcarbamoyladenylate synthase